MCIAYSSPELVKKGFFSELYYTLQSPETGFSVIMVSYYKKSWSFPVVASFSGMYNDLEPFITPDGQWLYFSSDRPLPGGSKQGFDIWRSKREGNKWGTPENLGSTINTSGNEFYPSLNSNGDIYFTAERKDGIGKEDIYISRKNKSGFEKAIPLDTSVNSTTYEFNAWIAPNDSLIIFSSYGRKDDLGRGDLYMAKKGKNGNWQKAVHMPVGINSKWLDYCPFIDAVGNFYFTSNRIDISERSYTIKTIKDWDNLTEISGKGSSDVYKIPSYIFRDKKRQMIGEEE
jgi:hypothetical protein